MTDTATRLRELRKGLGLSQAEFAKKLGASQGSISKWENGTEVPRVNVLLRIQQEYGIEVFQLLWPEEHKLGTAFGSEKPINVVGAIEYGVFRESPIWSQEDWLSIDLPLSKNFDLDLEGYVIKDDSANVMFSQNTVVFVNKGPGPHTNLMAVYDDDILLCRHRKGGLTENLLLRNQNIDGQMGMLEPITYNEEKQRRFDIRQLEDDSLKIRGIVMVSLHHLPAYDRVKDGSAAWLDLGSNSR